MENINENIEIAKIHADSAIKVAEINALSAKQLALIAKGLLVEANVDGES